MDNTNALNILKSIFISDDDDSVLLSYLNIAGDAILNRVYPYDSTQTEVPTRYINTQVNIAIYLLNKRGAEGETSHNENGVNRSYGSADIPDDMLKNVLPRCGVIK